jgi:ketosteroid isomerase-like protein
MKPGQKKCIERYVRAYNGFDIQGMTADLSSDIVFENSTNGAVNLRTEGIEAFRKQAEAARNYFSSRNQQIVSWSSSGQTITVEILWEGVPAADLPNGTRAGEKLSLSGRSVFEFKGEKISRITDLS